MEEDLSKGYKNKKFGHYREMLYSGYSDGKYEKEVGYHNETDRTTLEQAWDLFNDRIEDARKKVLAGEASPILYHMEKMLVTPMDLSMHAGIMVWRVKRHLKPKKFNKLSEKTLKKYADAFNISIDQLKKVE